MKSLIQNIAIYSFSLYLLTFILDGVKISGGWLGYVFAGSVLYLMFLVLKPILSIVSLPLNLATLGAFSFVVNALILYLLTVFLTNISVKAFLYKGFSLAGFVIPQVQINTFFAFLVASLVLSVIISFLTWIVKK